MTTEPKSSYWVLTWTFVSTEIFNDEDPDRASSDTQLYSSQENAVAGFRLNEQGEHMFDRETCPELFEDDDTVEARFAEIEEQAASLASCGRVWLDENQLVTLASVDVQ